MMKRFHIAALGACLLATSCTVTGDPTKGGIFWSAEKAQARQLTLQEELNSYNASLASQNKVTSKLVSKRNRISAELKKLDTELKNLQQNGGGDAESKALMDKKARLQAQLDSLR